jgi:hypothetical protein
MSGTSSARVIDLAATGPQLQAVRQPGGANPAEQSRSYGKIGIGALGPDTVQRRHTHPVTHAMTPPSRTAQAPGNALVRCCQVSASAAATTSASTVTPAR